jgi:flagellar assembly factor FliW
MSSNYISTLHYISVKDKEVCVCSKEVEMPVDSGEDTKHKDIANVVRMEGNTRILGAISLDNEMIRDFKRGMENYINSTSVTTKPAITPNILRMEGNTKILSAISLDNEMIRDFKRGMENYRNSTSVTTKPAITPNIVRMEGNTRILGAISLDNEMIRDFKRGMEAYKNTMKPLPSVEQPANGAAQKIETCLRR